MCTNPDPKSTFEFEATFIIEINILIQINMQTNQITQLKQKSLMFTTFNKTNMSRFE